MTLVPTVSLWALSTFLLLSTSVIYAFQVETSAFVGKSRSISSQRFQGGAIHNQLHIAKPIIGESMTMILETTTQSKRWTPPTRRKQRTNYSTGNNFVRRGPRRQNSRKPSMTPREANEQYTLLLEKTRNLLDVEVHPLKSLIEEKWHYSMMRAWSKLIEDSGSSIFPVQNNNNNKNNNNKNSNLTSRHIVGGDGMHHVPTIIDKILKRIVDEKTAGNDDIRITSEMYSVTLKAWATTAALGPDPDIAAKRSLSIVKEMQTRYEDDNDESIKPDSYSLRIALGAFAKACAFCNSPTSRAFAKASAICNAPCSKGSRASHDLAEQAHEALLWMESLAETGKNDDARPNAVAYARVMDAYAKSGDKDAGSKAEALLRYMQNDAGVRPNTYCYNMVLNAYTRQKRRDGAVENAERILSELEEIYRSTGDTSLQPDVVSYTSLVSAWARSNRKGYGARRAEAIVKQMEAFAVESGNPLIRPNSITYNVVLKAWCRSGDSDAVENAERILNKLEEIYHSTGDKALQPDVVSYTTLVTAWTNSHRKAYGARRAEEIVKRMEAFAEESGNPSVRPNTVTYNTVLNAWCRSGDRDAPTRSLAIFRAMQKESIAGNRFIAPDIITFNTLVRTLVNDDTVESAQLAEDILVEMECSERGAGMLYCSPDLWVYNNVIKGWSRLPDSIGAEKAYLILLRLIQREKKDIVPDAFSFNTVLFALSKNNDLYSVERVEGLLRYMEKLGINAQPLNPNLRP